MPHQKSVPVSVLSDPASLNAATYGCYCGTPTSLHYVCGVCALENRDTWVGKPAYMVQHLKVHTHGRKVLGKRGRGVADSANSGVAVPALPAPVVVEEDDSAEPTVRQVDDLDTSAGDQAPINVADVAEGDAPALAILADDGGADAAMVAPGEVGVVLSTTIGVQTHITHRNNNKPMVDWYLGGDRWMPPATCQCAQHTTPCQIGRAHV